MRKSKKSGCQNRTTDKPRAWDSNPDLTPVLQRLHSLWLTPICINTEECSSSQFFLPSSTHAQPPPAHSHTCGLADTLPRLEPVSHILCGSLPLTGTEQAGSPHSQVSALTLVAPFPTQSTHSSCCSQITSPKGMSGGEQGILGLGCWPYHGLPKGQLHCLSLAWKAVFPAGTLFGPKLTWGVQTFIW